MLAEVEQLHELVGELLEVHHDLLLVLQDVIVLLGAVHCVNEVWVVLVGHLHGQHLGLGVLAVGRVNDHLDGQRAGEVFAILSTYSDVNAGLVEYPIELEATALRLLGGRLWMLHCSQGILDLEIVEICL